MTVEAVHFFQCLDKETFDFLDFRGDHFIEARFHDYPEVVVPGYEVLIDPEQFFHFSLYKIPLYRVPDLPVYRNGEPVVPIIVLQEVKKKKRFFIFPAFLNSFLKSSSRLILW